MLKNISFDQKQPLIWGILESMYKECGAERHLNFEEFMQLLKKYMAAKTSLEHQKRVFHLFDEDNSM
jgi:Ca2+-binding EF-hand superfamily protein